MSQRDTSDAAYPDAKLEDGSEGSSTFSNPEIRSKIVYDFKNHTNGLFEIHARNGSDEFTNNLGLSEYHILYKPDGTISAIWGTKIGSRSSQRINWNQWGHYDEFLRGVMKAHGLPGSVETSQAIQVTLKPQDEKKAEVRPQLEKVSETDPQISAFLDYLGRKAEDKQVSVIDLLVEDQLWTVYALTDRNWSDVANDAFRLKVIRSILQKLSKQEKFKRAKLKAKETELEGVQSQRSMRRWQIA